MKDRALSANVSPDKLLRFNLDGCVQKICKPSMSYGAAPVIICMCKAIVNFFFNVCLGIDSSFIQIVMNYMYYELHCNSIQGYLDSEQYALIPLTPPASEELSKLSREFCCR